VAETYDGFLNDARGQHVSVEHVRHALDGAHTGAVDEGNVGGGAGMALFGFKGGIGTSSRMVEVAGARYALGVLVQGNTGAREDLVLAGVPVGRMIDELRPTPGGAQARDGSIIVVIATDAPLSERQCRRLCKRGIMGLGRVGLTARNSSGDLLIAFSNNPACRLDREAAPGIVSTPRLDDRLMNALFSATVEATAEAVLNALVAAETMTGRDGNTVYGFPAERLAEMLAGQHSLVI
jgi:D-aminopeptidase